MKSKLSIKTEQSRRWTEAELKMVVDHLQPLSSLKLQEVGTQGEKIGLGFYSRDGVLWLLLDLDPVQPTLLPWMERPLPAKNKSIPMLLFLRAHFLGQKLLQVLVTDPQQRLVRLEFAAGHLDFRMTPHTRNLSAYASGKELHWQKPAPLVSADEFVFKSNSPSRTLTELREEWQSRNQKSLSKARGSDKNSTAQRQSKIEQAIKKVEAELERKRTQPWAELGQWLKANQSLKVPKEWEMFVDQKRSLAWNIENIFAEAQSLKKKIIGTEQRLVELMQQKKSLASGESIQSSERPKTPKQNRSAEPYKGRSLLLPSGAKVIAGKSAADNMQLLRRAKAWDLWFHLRDFPGAHAVLFRNKTDKISDAELQMVGEWLIKKDRPAESAALHGEKMAVVVTECRYVKPIKGDRLGRVNYQNERVFICRLAP